MPSLPWLVRLYDSIRGLGYVSRSPLDLLSLSDGEAPVDHEESPTDHARRVTEQKENGTDDV